MAAENAERFCVATRRQQPSHRARMVVAAVLRKNRLDETAGALEYGD
jgi:hypothetical protein